jgi:hypothetical protein
MKQARFTTVARGSGFGREIKKLSDAEVIWETFDGLFKTLHRQGRRVEELEARLVELERRLQERATVTGQQPRQFEPLAELPAERAA